jgi:hypothetical protein
VAHFDGHFAGHLGAPGISLDRRLLGFDFDYLWLGNRASIRQTAVLSPIGTALEDQTPTGYNPSAWNRGLFKFGFATDAWRDGIPDFTSDFLLVFVFRAANPITAITNLVSDREGSPNFFGWEVFLDASGALTTTWKSDISAPQVFSLPTDLSAAGLPQVAAVRARAGTIELATVLDSTSAALNAGSFASTAQFSIGAGRLNTSADIEIGFVGLVIDGATHLVAPDLQQDVVFEIAAELTVSQVQGSDVIDSTNADTFAWNPEYL